MVRGKGVILRDLKPGNIVPARAGEAARRETSGRRQVARLDQSPQIINEMGPLALMSRKPCILSRVCTVFAESEVISLLSENRVKEDIAYGISKSIAKRVIGMGAGGQIGYKEPIVFSGGVAKNIGVAKAIEEELGKK